ncbi:aminotransferase class IV [Actinokineospora auranticolor]|uniref:Branched-chain amino acid aminotransferase n=1 Tax=Actinokineospora auranticolor TaxID=155976 RepID=A0A2S6GI51_9PSEU|nr:aminotransferase class IV [Actinokineospora auranticolor]PPK64841.1 branched-chain amino acid aminotransferase [Actinokineospora auranticolor]
MTGYPHVYFAGAWRPRGQAVASMDSLALRYALSVFEGVRLYRGIDGARPRPFLLAEHLDRMRTSLSAMRLPDPGVDQVPALVRELVDRNGIDQDAYARITATPLNAGGLGDDAETALTVTATPMGRKRWLAEGIGMSLAVSATQRAPSAAFPAAVKNISNYAGPRLALLAAKDAGHDGCVLSNRWGRLCEAPTAALFLVRDGTLLTPALTEDVLPSITRAWLLAEAARTGLPARETTLTAEDAYRCDEAFLCGTGIELAPVRAFDGRPCGHWPDDRVTRLLAVRYFTAARGGAGPRSALLAETAP